MIFPLLLGLTGAGILLALGNWQVHRLAWKNDLLAQITREIAKPPVDLDVGAPGIGTQKYKAVRLGGTFGARSLRVLTSRDPYGPGYRIVVRLDTPRGAALVDLGFQPERGKAVVLPKGKVSIVGNLHWPEETDGFTPAPSKTNNLWFARDVPAMAKALGTAQVFVVARTIDPPVAGVLPWPVDTSNIVNNHLQYAITWFSLAVLWLGMTVYWLWRIRHKTDQ